MLPLLAAAALAADPPAADCADPNAPCELMIVSASRVEQLKADAIAPVQVITRAEIEATGATTLDEALRGVPGLQVSRDFGGATISLQGLDPEHTLVLVDGRPLAGRVDGSVDLARIPAADIERIEILPGPASALYGSEALGGVVNVITRRGGDTPRASVALRAGTRSLAEASGQLSGGFSRVQGGLALDTAEQEGWRTTPTATATVGDDLQSWGGRAWLRAQPGERFNLEAAGDYHQRDAEGVSASAAGAVFDVRTLQETANVSLDLRAVPTNTLMLQTRLGGALWRQQYLENQVGSDVQDAYQDTLDRRATASFLASWFPKRHTFVAGIDTTAEALSSERLDSGEAARERLAVFAQDDWSLLPGQPRLALSPGARLDIDSQFGLHATPHLAVRYDPVPDLSLRVSAGRGYRAPEFKELYLAFDHASYGYSLTGNPELLPESSTGVTVDVSVRPLGGLELRASGWWNEVENLINPALLAEGTADTVATYTYENVGRAVTRGATASASWSGSGPITAGADYTFTNALDRDTDEPLSGRSPHRVSARLGLQPHRSLRFDTSVEWSSERPYTLGDSTTYSPASTWLEARLAWRFTPAATLELGAHNLLDARDDDFLGLPPRTLYVGLRADAALERP